MIWLFYWYVIGMVSVALFVVQMHRIYGDDIFPIKVKDIIAFLALSWLGVIWSIIVGCVAVNQLYNSDVWRNVMEYELIPKKKDSDG